MTEPCSVIFCARIWLDELKFSGEAMNLTFLHICVKIYASYYNGYLWIFIKYVRICFEKIL